jgi:uncharacterized protein DUF6790
MIATAIKFVLTNLFEILFVAAFVIAAFINRPSHFPRRLLDWLLLLSVGAGSVWAGLFHIFFPHIAASSIGWEVSPFQFEIGVADTAIGIVAILSFWRSLDFKGAVVGYIVLFYAGVAVGHVHEAITANNYSPDNFGPLLVITVAQMLLFPVLYILARRTRDLGDVARLK